MANSLSGARHSEGMITVRPLPRHASAVGETIIHQPGKFGPGQCIYPEKAWKIAGLPKLDGIHFIPLSGENYAMEECC